NLHTPPCILGVESPTHALRADADPGARSASTTYITLAESHQYDRNLEIILHPSEPHVPHVILEEGSMSFKEYEQQIRSRRDFSRVVKKDSSFDKKVEFVRKRFHKDIAFNPVLMLNFCPDLQSIATEFGHVTREIIFLIDRSAMLVAVKSLPPGTLLNIIGFGSNVKTLFSSSRICNDDTLSLACEYIQRMRADMGGTNILGALSWIFNQTVQRGYPRQLFILTDGSMGNTAKIIELVRKNLSIRCFSYGLGPNACKRLLHGVAKVTGGTVEFFKEGERLQPKLIKSLKKAIEPVMSDITIEWYLPDTLEVLLSPTEIGPLYPGEHLISYGVLFDLSGPKAPSRGSTSSVFQTQEDPPTPTTSDSIKSPLLKENNGIEEALKEISREISLEFSGGNISHCYHQCDSLDCYFIPDFETDPLHNIRKRIYHPSYIHEQYTLTHCSVSSERGIPTTTHGSNSSDSTEPHDMESASLPHGLESITEQGQKSLLRWELTRKPFSLPTSEMVISKVSNCPGLSRFTNINKAAKTNCSLSFQASTPDWDTFFDPESLFSPVISEELSVTETDSVPAMHCKSVIYGLICGKPVTWDVTTSLTSLYGASIQEEPMQNEENVWKEILHQLAAQSVIKDFENMAEKESEIEYGKYISIIGVQLHLLSRCVSLDFDGTDVTSHDIATSSPENLSITFQQTDSGRGSETDLCENSPVSSEASNAFCEPANDLDPQDEDLEGMGWATAVALGWLEHQCASYFVEWELIAAKADSWLQVQHLPEGVNMGGLKVAARQLFLLLRHWNENIKLNMLCYNPNNM
uniref:von Willebrand factor A domain containing 5B2 n=1 Tax=Callorhinchus milii TaxID=7868 RepID=A0A4W3HRT9_CALMI